MERVGPGGGGYGGRSGGPWRDGEVVRTMLMVVVRVALIGHG